MVDFSIPNCPTNTNITASSFFDSDSDEDDDFLKNSSFSDQRSSAEVCRNRNGRYDPPSSIAKINRIIEENEKSILHAVEVASARVTQIESRTRRLESSMDDLKVCVEYNHRRTDGKLREMENILKEVHMDAKCLLNKQEIAETELHLFTVEHYRTEHEPEIRNFDVQTTLPQQKPCLSSGELYQPVLNYSHTSAQPIFLSSSAYPNLTPMNCPQTHAPFVPSVPLPQNAHPQYTPYRPQFEPYANSRSYIHQSFQSAEFRRVSDRSSVPENTIYVPPSYSYDDFASYSEDSPVNSSYYSSQVVPNALPRASFLDSKSNSSGKLKKASNEDIIEEVTAMGFRRDMVIAAVRKLTQNQVSVDLNTLIDKLMN